MQRALVTFKAAGLHSPLAGPSQEEFWLQLWVERYGALEASLFTGASKSWPVSVIFRGCTIWTKLFRTLKKGCCWHGGARRSTGQTVTSLICLDPANSKRRVRELIEHLEKKFTLAAGQ